MNVKKKMFSCCRVRQGALLLFVLGMIAMLSFVMVQIINYAQTQFQSKASDMVANSMRLDAYNALYAVIAELEEFVEVDGGLYSADQGWGRCFSEGRVELPSGSEVEIKIEDLCSKISLPNISHDDFKAVFEFLGFTDVDAQAIADCFFDWTDSDDAVRQDGAEKDDYDDYSAKPPNRPLESFSELRLIKGFDVLFFDENGAPNELYEIFTRIFSLEQFRETNVNSASAEVLEVLCEMSLYDYDERIFDAIRGKTVPISDGITWLKNSEELESRGFSLPPKNIGYQTSRLKIEVRVKRGLAEYVLCAIYGTPLSSSASNTKNSTGNVTKAADTKSGFYILKISERADND